MPRQPAQNADYVALLINHSSSRYRSRSREHAPELCTGAERAILDLVERRPATLADLTVALGLPQEEIQILLDSLFKFGLLEMEKQERETFYAPARH